jgi:hypothetical protein
MKNYEKLGAFYLGRRHDLERRETSAEPLLYDSKDLTTHAVCVGMTGSGKTGLCISLLEEAALDGVPAIVIDPKGDLGNLMLTFPELRGEDFRPWVDPDAARREGQSLDAHAEAQAALWRRGLASWDQDGDRIRALRRAAEFAIYTPGSEAGLPLSIVSSFGAPPEELLRDPDSLRERVATTAAGLLGLMGIKADPLRSREHILLSTLLADSWRERRSLDLPGLIRLIQTPPVDRVGVMELDSFYPSADRFELAMRLNNLLAAPSFQGWLRGAPLEVDELLHTPGGKPRVAILSIAHLSDNERMFFVSLLLNQVLGWMRSRPGTTSLRALLYMDEIFGYVPPTAEPPSKKPFLTLLKQARAYGLGVVLATQNPVDLDYKGLSNTGTWFLGRLQTERDKNRVLDGLEGVAAGGREFDKPALERTLAGLGKRVFLMHNVHEGQPVVFQTRWAMSYLRGPLTRDQIRDLMHHRADDDRAPATRGASPARNIAIRSRAADEPSAAPRPLLPPQVPQVFLPVRAAGLQSPPAYEPMLLGLGRVRFVDRKTKALKQVDDVALLIGPRGSSLEVDWESASPVDLCREDLDPDPILGASFGSVPADAENARNFSAWRRLLSDCLYRTRRLELHQSPSLGLISEPGESEREFRLRLVDLAREKRDRLAESLRKKYGRRMATLGDRVLRARQAVERESQQAAGQKMQTAISLGSTLLNAFLGRKVASSGTLGRATTTVRGMGRAAKEKRDVEAAKERLAVRESQLADLERELEGELEELEDRLDPLAEELATSAVTPRRSDVEARLVALAWAPYGVHEDGSRLPLWE